MSRIITRTGQSRISRRGMLAGTAAAGAGIALAHPLLRPHGVAAQTDLSVLSPLAPDPAPPGVADFSIDAFDAWQAENDASVSYEAVSWGELHDKMATNFASGTHVHDVMYNCGWVPEFASFLTPIGGYVSEELRADLPPSSFSTVTWDGEELGVVFSLSLLTLFYNQAHLEAAGLEGPPADWDALKGYAEALTGDGKYGWVLNYGAPEGIGGVASYWMTFLQQAGRHHVRRRRYAGLQRRSRRRCAPAHDRPDAVHRAELDCQRRHQRRDQCLRGRHRVDDDELALHVDRRPESRRPR